MKKIYPCLWFNGNGQEAFSHYKTIFGDNLNEVSNNGMVIMCDLFDQRIMILNAQSTFAFNESFSFTIECDTQEEIDEYWAKLSEGGTEQQCGWLKDRHGLSWQIIPTILKDLMSNQEKSQKVIDAFMQMKKFDIEKLKQAAQ